MINKKLYIILLILMLINTNNYVSYANNNQHNTNISNTIKYNYKDTLNYHSNAITFKIKSNIKLNSDSISFDSEELNKLLRKLNIVRIIFPYRKYFNNNSKFNDYYNISNICEVYYKNNYDPLEICNEIKNIKDIEYICPIMKHTLCSIPNDSLYSVQTELQMIKAEQAWNISQGSDSVIIGIVDSECDWTHEDLANNIWSNPNEIPDNGIDDDSNGKIDDVHGWDLMGNTNYADYSAGNYKEDNDTKLPDSCNGNIIHGTSVASCASAVTNNTHGIASIGNKCKILPVKICSDLGYMGREHEGILYAATMGAKIINCSWTGVGSTKAEMDILKQVYAMGSLVVVAAGNNNGLIDYGENNSNNFYNCMFVGSSTKADSVANFSNYGILTAVYTPGLYDLCCNPDNQYSIKSGTSLSAPITCGIAGLVLSEHLDWSPRQVYHQIRGTSDRIFYSDSSDMQPYYFGRANAYKALTINKDFSSGETIPGIEFTDWNINGAKDTIKDYSDYTLQLNVKNYLAPTKNLKVSLKSLDSFLIFENNTINVPTLNTNKDTVIEFTIKLNPNDVWTLKYTKLLVTFTDSNYLNYQQLLINIAPNPKKSWNLEANYVDSLANFYITQIAAVNIDTVWGAGTNENNGQCYVFKATEKGIFYLQNLPIVYKIQPLNSKKAFIYYYNDSLSSEFIAKTTDGGLTWKNLINLDTMNTLGCGHYVMDFFFSDINNGVIFCRNVILKTNDGGCNWENIQGIKDILSLNDDYLYSILELNSESFLNYSLINYSYFENCYKFITSKSNFIISCDNGNSWIYDSSSNNKKIQRFQFVNNNKGISFNIKSYSNTSAVGSYWCFVSTTDGGLNWKANNLYNFNYINYTPLASYIDINDNNKIIVVGTTDNFINSSDFGESWYPINISYKDTNSNPISTGCPISNIKKIRFWLSKYDSDKTISKLYYVDFDNIINPQENQNLNSIIIDAICYPNPNGNNIATLQYYLKEEANVNIKIYDYTGQELMQLFNGKVKGNQYETFSWNASLLASGVYYYLIKANNDFKILSFEVCK